MTIIDENSIKLLLHEKKQIKKSRLMLKIISKLKTDSRLKIFIKLLILQTR